MAGHPGRLVRCLGRQAAEVSGPDAGLDEDDPMTLGDAIEAAPLAGQELSLWGLFWQAHIVVQLVMIGLAGASIYSWAIIIDKTVTFRRLNRAMDRFEEVFWSGQSLEDLYRSLHDRPTTGMASVFVSAMREWKRSFEGTARAFGSLPQRIDKVLDVTIQREIDRLESRLIFLASIGSAGPYLGLFGTVWGVMTAFTAIAASNNTSLAVVAPGIAEALFATAIGLFAAIPAVIAYNKLQSEVSRAQSRMEGFADEFSAILVRQVDERLASQAA